MIEILSSFESYDRTPIAIGDTIALGLSQVDCNFQMFENTLNCHFLAITNFVGLFCFVKFIFQSISLEHTNLRVEISCE